MWSLISAFFLWIQFLQSLLIFISLWEKLLFQYILTTNYEGMKIHKEKVRNKNLIECHKNWADKMPYLQLQCNTVKNLFSFMYFLNRIFSNTKTPGNNSMLYKTTLFLASLKSMYSETATKFEKNHSQ